MLCRNLSFKNRICSWFEFEHLNNRNMLRTRDLMKIISKIEKVDTIADLHENYYSYGTTFQMDRFRMDDSIQGIDSEERRVPWPESTIISVQRDMPFVYNLLEKNDHLWSPRLPYHTLGKEYVQILGREKDFTTTEYNDRAKKVMAKIDPNWVLDIATSGYVVLPHINEFYYKLMNPDECSHAADLE